MKKFTFKIEVIVYGDSEDEAKTTFCEDPNSWEFDESDLTLVSEEGLDFITILNQKVNSTG